jgi:hypothetical protein
MRAIGRFALAASAALAAAAPAAAAPGDRQFTVVADHNPAGALRALRAGVDFVKGHPGRQFRLILSGGGVIVAIPGTSSIQREAYKMIQGTRGLQVIACRETLEALSRANRRTIPVLPGVSSQRCAGLRNRMTVDGWQVAPGI